MAASNKVTPVTEPYTRRGLLWRLGGGLGGIALAQLLGERALLAGTGAPTRPVAELNGGLHHRPRPAA